MILPSRFTEMSSSKPFITIMNTNNVNDNIKSPKIENVLLDNVQTTSKL